MIAATKETERAQQLATRKIEFVEHPRFKRDDVEDWLETLKPRVTNSVPPSKPGGGMPPYLTELYRYPLLEPDEERFLFLRMNFLKYDASRLQCALESSFKSRDMIRRIEQRLDDALTIRNQIVESNLRLVVSIAKKFAAPGLTVDDLVSDGNAPLFRSVELFNVARGFRFSTYASYAIRNHFNRVRAQWNNRNHLFQNAEQFVMDEMIDECPDYADRERHCKRRGDLVSKLLENLSSRDNRIVRERYGLTFSGQENSFAHIGRQIGLSKERVRQLSMRAMRQLQSVAVAESV